MLNDKEYDSIYEAESFRDRLATVDEKGKRKWIYATKPKGRFYNARTYISWLFFAIFLSLPFIYVNGRPLFMFNILKAKFILFGQIFWPQDFFIFGITTITFIVFIVLFTAAFGRLFCGWVCPQTIFLEMLFRKIEYAIEGDANKQRLLNNGPWNGEKIRKKTIKYVIFYLLSFFIANIFLTYIISYKDLLTIITGPVEEHIGGLLGILLFSSIFFFVYVNFREQSCTVVCPYGRLQSVLLDRNSVIVAYDYERGEPRGKIKKGEESNKMGDCVDCGLCVRVCPTGIDIRNGTQMECVACTACIDACDEIMDKVKRPRGLVRYASENGIEKGEKLRYTGRMKFYTVVLFLLVGILSFLIFTRKDVNGTLLRAEGLLYQERGTDSISNLYTIKLSNKTLDNMPLTFKVESPFNGRIQTVGTKQIHVNAESQGSGSFFVILNNDQIKKRSTKLKIGIYHGNKKILEKSTTFLGPIN